MSMNIAPMLELSVTAVSPEIDIGIRADRVEMMSQTARAPQVMSKLGHIRLTPGTRVVISNNDFSIGRGSENDLYIRDLRISRQHARIFSGAGESFALHNLSSSNPTALNGQKLEANKQRPMANSGLIQLADIVNIEFTNSVGTVQLHTIPREVALAKPTNVLDLQGVGRQFGEEQVIHALKDVDLSLAPGEWLSITGPSGAGKSTLLNIIGCLDHPTSGAYLFDGIDTTGLTDQERAGLRSRRIGFVFQSFHLLPHRSVLENVMLAEVYRQQSLTGRRERALAALERVGLGNRVNFRPTELSGGSAKEWPLRGRSLAILVCWSVMSRPATWIPKPPKTFSISLKRSIRKG
ncbi:MAG: FHA domain-containing protein [Caldilineaceae bacterium]